MAQSSQLGRAATAVPAVCLNAVLAPLFCGLQLIDPWPPTPEQLEEHRPFQTEVFRRDSEGNPITCLTTLLETDVKRRDTLTLVVQLRRA